MEIREKYLPIGSVVLLDGGTRKAMITGFCTMTPDTPDKVYDYCGCVYPEGVIRSDQTCVFDHNQIKEVFFYGYENEEETEFKTKLVEALKNMDNNTNTDEIENL